MYLKLMYYVPNVLFLMLYNILCFKILTYFYANIQVLKIPLRIYEDKILCCGVPHNSPVNEIYNVTVLEFQDLRLKTTNILN